MIKQNKKSIAVVILSAVLLAVFCFLAFQPKFAKAEDNDTYTLGVSASQNPSNFGDPYLKRPYWFYGEFSPESILTSGVTFSPEHSNIMVFLQQLYLLVSSYKTDMGGTDLTTVVSFTNGSQTVSITFYYAYTATEPSYDSYITTSDEKTIYYHGGNYQVPYVLPYNALYVTDVFFSVYGGMYTLSAATLPSGDDFLVALSALFGDYIPMFQSKGYIDSLTSGGGGGTADYNSGYQAGFGSGFNVGFNQGVSSVPTADQVIQDYLNSEEYQQEIDFYKNQGILDYKNSEEYRQALQNREDLGYNRGKAIGYNEGLDFGQKGSFFALFSAVFDAPISVIMGLVDFEILGYNLKQFILSIFTVLLIIVLIRFFLTFSSK